MKTLQEIKDETAREKGFKDWSTLFTASGTQYLEKEKPVSALDDTRLAARYKGELRQYCGCDFVMIMRHHETEVAYCSECGREVYESTKEQPADINVGQLVIIDTGKITMPDGKVYNACKCSDAARRMTQQGWCPTCNPQEMTLTADGSGYSFTTNPAKEEASHVEQFREKFYDVDFGGHVCARIKILDNKIEIAGAINGYGYGISLSDIKITEWKQ